MTRPINILFLQDNGINESLALTELSGWLRARGHVTTLLLEREERRFAQRILAARPDLVVLPCNVYASGWVRKKLRLLRRILPDVPRLVGGTHPTFATEFIREAEVDLQLVGEAELAVAELADRIAAGRPYEDIPGIWSKRDGIVRETGPAARLDNLDELPLPDRMLYNRYPFMARFPWKKFTTGRGCSNDCAFCYNHFIKRLYGGERFVRRKSPARVIAEVTQVRREARLEWVHFADDLFVTGREWLGEFAARYPDAVGLPFSCNSSADRMDEEIARTLAAAGCRVVAMGVETADEETRVRLMNKPATDRVIRAAAGHIKRAGMELVVFLMVAVPGEQLPGAAATLKLARELRADGARILMAVPLPGTAMTMAAARAGQVDPRAASDFHGHIDFHENPYGPYYDVPEPGSFETLVNLAPWLSPLPAPAMLTAARLLPRRLTRPLRAWMSFQEKRLYRFSLLDGIRFYRHVGNPMARTTNYVSLI